LGYTAQTFGKDWPRVSRAVAEATRALAAHAGSFPAVARALDDLVGGGLTATAGPVVVGARAGDDPIVWARAADGRGFAVAADGALVGALAARILALEPPDEAVAPRAPTPAERGIFAFVVAALVDGGSLAVAVDDAPPPAGALSIEIRCEVGGARGSVRVLVPTDAVRVPPPVRGDGRRLAPVRVALAVVRGRVRVAAARVAALRPRDVVLFPDAEPLLAVARGGFPCRLDDGAARVVGPYRRGSAMDEALARDLPVELTCELGRITLSAAEVLALAPGAIVTLPARVGAPVELCAGGRVLARGELIDVDGQVGVRIAELP
jgi:type III secretion system YscQ/HrcQ family protein